MTTTTADTLGPRSVEVPSDRGWTLVGTLDAARPARVDRGGLVVPDGGGWSVDWWVAADHRWCLPSREATVRQRRLGAGPVIETSMRIPGGDVRQVSYGALLAGQAVTVIEVTNDSPAPIALAFALRPYDLDGATLGGHRGRLRIDDRAVWAGDRPLLHLPRRPLRAEVAREDPLARVVAGAELSDLARTGPISADRDGGHAVVVYPVAHRTSLRVAVPTGGSGWSDPALAPDRESVERGWERLLGTAAGYRFPDPGLSALVDGARARCLLAASGLAARAADLAPGAGVELSALAFGGHRGDLATVIGELVEAFPTRLGSHPSAGAELVTGMADAHLVLVERPGPAALELAAQITHLVERSGHREAGAAARRALARLARRAGEDAGADHLAVGDVPAQPTPSERHAHLVELAEAASPTGTWLSSDGADHDDPATAARLVIAARSMVLDDTGTGLALLPSFPSAWRGGALEVHRAPGERGTASFALRWHGYRPALLWQVDGLRGELSCPRLDPSWSTSQERGETLLTGSAAPLADAPVPGDSFQ